MAESDEHKDAVKALSKEFDSICELENFTQADFTKWVDDNNDPFPIGEDRPKAKKPDFYAISSKHKIVIIGEAKTHWELNANNYINEYSFNSRSREQLDSFLIFLEKKNKEGFKTYIFYSVPLITEPGFKKFLLNNFDFNFCSLTIIVGD